MIHKFVNARVDLDDRHIKIWCTRNLIKKLLLVITVSLADSVQFNQYENYC